MVGQDDRQNTLGTVLFDEPVVYHGCSKRKEKKREEKKKKKNTDSESNSESDFTSPS